MEFTKLPIDKEIKRFEEHLNLENNNKILLSGVFGIGKSYFINEFFHINKEDYVAVNLSPVNYSVSSNDDIFELIKFDIIFQLLSKNPKFEKTEIAKQLAGEHYILNNFKSLVKKLFQNFSKLDQKLSAVTSSITSLNNEIEEFKRKNETDDKRDLEKFIEEFQLKKGSLYEEDHITILITFLLDTIAVRGKSTEIKDDDKIKGKKKTILVIDDLDRIDPEHIFRILNTFSSHFDVKTLDNKNKFGFDKIIIVCDINNIRGIFHNRYGTGTDFTGYIDKFYSQSIFEYQFANVIVESLNKFYRSISSLDKNIEGYVKRGFDNYYTNQLSLCLEYFVYSNSLNMRSLISFLEHTYEPSKSIVKWNGNYHLSPKNTPIILIFDILIKIFGGFDNLISAIDKTIDRFPKISLESYNSFWNQYLGNLILFLNSNSDGKDNLLYHDKELDLQISYSIYRMDYGASGDAKKIGNFGQDLENMIPIHTCWHNEIPYFQIFKKALLAYHFLPTKNS